MLSIHTTNHRKKVAFKPLVEGAVSMYVCGPTVYDKGHLGHGRSAVAFDMVRRYLMYRKFKVTYVSNYTDIDDKMINRAAERGISVPELANEIIPLYVRDFAELRVLPADVSPRATEFVPQMIELIGELELKGLTYVISDGVYFDVSKFEMYGALSGQQMEDLQAGARKEVNTEKKNHQDFVLWKMAKSGEPAWASPWGSGRPGWHIECSAMVRSVLGQPIDLHGGGLDLTFPHHECEIAQSEAAYGVKFANYWLHNGFVNINKEKMSKSLHNFITLEDVLKVYEGRVIRFLYLQTHYHSPLDFSEEMLEQSKNGLARVDQFIALLRHYTPADDAIDLSVFFDQYRELFITAMDNDFDMPGAIGVMFSFINFCQDLLKRKIFSQDNVLEVLGFMDELDSVFAVLSREKNDIPDDVRALVAEREQVRKDRNFKRSDEIREELKAQGFEVEDTPDGPMVKRI